MINKDGLRELIVMKEHLINLALANASMILENAINMPDEYIVQYYGSDKGMLDVARSYFNFAKEIFQTPYMTSTESITWRSYEEDKDSVKDTKEDE